jgi:hypothetical protein
MTSVHTLSQRRSFPDALATRRLIVLETSEFGGEGARRSVFENCLIQSDFGLEVNPLALFHFFHEAGLVRGA